jgi:predicted nucleic acid-binding protein
MDVCCLNRPFDESAQERVFFETEAVLHIISNCEIGQWTLLNSSIIEDELSNLSNEDKRNKISYMLSVATENLSMTDESAIRAAEFQKHGVKKVDSYHLAVAESATADVLLTTDDQFIKAALRTDAKIIVANPAKWILEVM